jgi:miniconductance mechanosensitive channel
MSQSGGRRIKRSISIDMSTIRFLTDDEIERFSKFAPLGEYMSGKRESLDAHNAKIETGRDGFGDPRRLTNVGTFRAYIVQYLRSHPKLHQTGMTLLVRQLAPSPQGLPIELYVFTNDTNWVNYEGIQGDIFDHLLSMLPEFGLRAFQEPASGDFQTLAGKES